MAKLGNLFKGKETPAEERKEAKAVKSGKLTPAQYAKGESKEGHGKGAMAKGKALKSGKLPVEKYAKEDMRFKCGGKVKKMADGGPVSKPAPTKEQQYDAQQKMNKEKWSPVDAMKRVVKPADKKYAKGGGVESRGKTKGRFC